ncbi:hypothetical protein BRD01_07165 [Halobacteriales archaeon QS_8_65_32]|nr:MAG: hypothetical protein BRD01_07165 [Halobacteriales archaeon QS_8_65_32]
MTGTPVGSGPRGTPVRLVTTLVRAAPCSQLSASSLRPSSAVAADVVHPERVGAAERSASGRQPAVDPSDR